MEKEKNAVRTKAAATTTTTTRTRTRRTITNRSSQYILTHLVVWTGCQSYNIQYGNGREAALHWIKGGMGCQSYNTKFGNTTLNRAPVLQYTVGKCSKTTGCQTYDIPCCCCSSCCSGCSSCCCCCCHCCCCCCCCCLIVSVLFCCCSQCLSTGLFVIVVFLFSVLFQWLFLVDSL